jgi:hypothetical protein
LKGHLVYDIEIRNISVAMRKQQEIQIAKARFLTLDEQRLNREPDEKPLLD